MPAPRKGTHMGGPGSILRCGGAPAAAYLATEIVTAGPRHLGKILYDAAIRLCHTSMEALEDGQVQLAADRLLRAKAILAQLERLSRTRSGATAWSDHYGQAGARLTQAALYRSREAIAEALQALRDRRRTWQEFLTSAETVPLGDTSAKSWVG